MRVYMKILKNPVNFSKIFLNKLLDTLGGYGRVIVEAG